MDLIAKTADFSSNRVGVSHDPLDSRTTDLLANYTKTLTTEQKWAVMDMLLEMESGGSLAKCKKLYLPCLAGALGEALINAVDTVDYSADATPDATYWALQSQGLVNAVPTNIAAAALNVDFTGLGLTSLNFSMFYLNTLAYASVPSEAFAIYAANNYSSYVWTEGLGIQAPAPNFKIGGIDLNAVIPNYVTLGMAKELKGINLLGNTEFIAFRGATKDPVTYDAAPLEGSVTGTIDLSGLQHIRGTKPHGFIYFGEGLTDAEYASLNTAVNLLVAALSI